MYFELKFKPSHMNRKFLMKFLVILPLFIRGIHSAVVNGYEDTSDGYCDLEEYGRIPVGQYGQHAELCQQAYCGENFYRIESCGSAGTFNPNCKIEGKPGSYPKCCPDMQCDAWINKQKEWLCEWCDMRTSRRG